MSPRAEAREKRRARAYDGRVVRRLWPYIRPHARLLAAGLLLLVLVSASNLARTYLVKIAIDEALVPEQLGLLFWIAGGYFTLALAEFFLRRRQIYTVDRAGQNSLYDLRTGLFRHLQRLPASFHDRRPTGTLVGRVTTDIEALQELFSTGVVTIFGDLLFLGAMVVILFSLNWRLALLTLAAVPVLLTVTVLIRVRVREAYATWRSKLSRINGFLHEHLTGMPVVQMFNRESRTREEFRSINGELRGAQLRSVWWESNFSAITEMIGSMTLALILWYGGRLALGESGAPAATAGLTLGTLFAFIEYMQKFFQPLTELSQKYTVLQNAMTAAQRIFELMDEQEEPAGPRRAAELPAPRGEIAFEDVTFGYDPAEPVLRSVSFEVRPGERVAVVGATGSGKTTLLKLLTRLYEVQEGRVLLDGLDVRDYPAQALRRRIGMVPQDVFLFEGTVLDNIRLGHPEIGEEQAVAAADRLHLGEMVARFPGGYRERVKERGKNLSSGEKQLLSFARALAAAPEALALDEATSNVDSQTEHLLQEAVHALMVGRTSLIVAHRLSTIRDADRILVMHRGELVEQGSHEQLLARRGVYWRLYELQYREQEAA